MPNIITTMWEKSLLKFTIFMSGIMDTIPFITVLIQMEASETLLKAQEDNFIQT